MRPNKNGLLVRIDKKRQQQKLEKEGSIFIPPGYTYMQRYLQYGEILSVGLRISQLYPDIQVGDVAIFHHTVEHNSMLLVGTTENNDEIRAVNATPHEEDHHMSCQLHGTIKSDGTIIPYDTNLFLADTLEIFNKQEQLKSELIQLVDMEYDDDDIRKMQDEITQHRKGLQKSYVHSSDMKYKEDVERQINNLTRQQEELAKVYNINKPVVATISHVNPRMEDFKQHENILIHDKSILYPLSVGDMSYFLIRSEYVDKLDLAFN